MSLFSFFTKSKSQTIPTPKYVEYVAYITNSSNVEPPKANIFKNELGIELSFSRIAVGEYLITGTNAFTDYKKVVPIFNPQQGSPIVSNIFWNDVNSLGVYIWSIDGVLSDNFFVGNLVIRVYQ